MAYRFDEDYHEDSQEALKVVVCGEMNVGKTCLWTKEVTVEKPSTDDSDSEDDGDSDSEDGQREEKKKAKNSTKAIESTASPMRASPFKRVDDSKWMAKIKNKKLADNSYEGTFGNSGWGAKASAKLITVRGKDFRHEKTKKKRGSYKGGLIDMHTVRAIPLDNSSSEEEDSDSD
eukprot:g4101.t1